MTTVDLIVIGAGPGGYELAAREAARGKKVILVERDKLGGTCLNCGCIPTKVMCRSAQVMETVNKASDYGITSPSPVVDMEAVAARRDRIVEELRKGVSSMLAGVEIIKGEARLTPEANVIVDDHEYVAENVVIATGSKPVRLSFPGAELAMTSEHLLASRDLPGSMVIIGGGVIGMEFASIYSALGMKVTVLEYCREIIPALDSEVAKRLRTAMKRRGVEIVTGAMVESISLADGIYAVSYTEKGKSKSTYAGRVVAAAGRKAVIPEGFVEAGGKLDPRGFIDVDETFATSVKGVYAIGDVNGRCLLAHAATAQGLRYAGVGMNTDVVPAAVFTMPECAMVGLTEEQCKGYGYNYTVKKSTFRANGKAMALGLTDGLVKVIIDNDSGLVLGAHICGPDASILIQEVATVMSARLPARHIARSIHPHPTLNEAVQAAFLL